MRVTHPALWPTELRPDPDQAQRWLENELSKPEYQPSLLQRAIDLVQDLLGRIGARISDVGGLPPILGWLIVIGILAILALVLAWLAPAVRKSRTSTESAVFDGDRLQAVDHRRLAERALADGDLDRAVIEALRALAANLFERDLAPEVPGTTATEITGRAADHFPDEDRQLRALADTFNRVRYGASAATRAEAEDALALQRRLTKRTPGTGEVETGPRLAVPR